MKPDAITEKNFFTATPQLAGVHAWARARYAAPWAVFGAVLLRVAASTEPTVQLPGLIGGRASLNLLCAFVSASGGGKGVSDKVARLAWPAPITELPIGSGEGIAEAFRPPVKIDADNEPLTRALFNVPEIDTLAGLASRQGSILLATLKSVAMGEQIGQSNAQKATSRVVDAHSYRCCLSIGAQPGHCGVIFSDTTGGTPQRLLWFPTTDPDMPDEASPDPAPLDTARPRWVWTINGERERGGLRSVKPGAPAVAEIIYGVEEIRETVIGAHLARQRGQGDALDGHALLTRCKVAALLAIMHQRQTVTGQDWELSGVVMEVSDRTRQWVLDHAKQAERAKIRDRAVARAAGEDFYDASRLETVKRSLLRMLDRDGEQPAGDLRSRLGRREKRELFHQAIALLEADGLVSSRTGTYNGASCTYWSPLTMAVTPQNSRSEAMTTVVRGDRSEHNPEQQTPSSPESARPQLSAPKWFANHIAELLAAGHTTVRALAVTDAGVAAGYSRSQIASAASASPSVVVIDRSGGGATWSITGEGERYQPAASWTANYLANNGPDVTADAFEDAARAAGMDIRLARNALRQLRHARSAAAAVAPRGAVNADTEPA